MSVRRSARAPPAPAPALPGTLCRSRSWCSLKEGGGLDLLQKRLVVDVLNPTPILYQSLCPRSVSQPKGQVVISDSCWSPKECNDPHTVGVTLGVRNFKSRCSFRVHCAGLGVDRFQCQEIGTFLVVCQNFGEKLHAPSPKRTNQIEVPTASRIRSHMPLGQFGIPHEIAILRLDRPCVLRSNEFRPPDAELASAHFFAVSCHHEQVACQKIIWSQWALYVEAKASNRRGRRRRQTDNLLDNLRI